MRFLPSMLIDRGYIRYNYGDHILFQKRVRGESGTRYFINIKEMDLTALSPHGRIMQSVEIQFITPEPNEVVYNISMTGDALTIEEAEARMEHLFIMLGCRNYD